VSHPGVQVTNLIRASEAGAPDLSFTKTSAGAQAVDLSVLIWPQSQLDGHPSTLVLRQHLSRRVSR